MFKYTIVFVLLLTFLAGALAGQQHSKYSPSLYWPVIGNLSQVKLNHTNVEINSVGEKSMKELSDSFVDFVTTVSRSIMIFGYDTGFNNPNTNFSSMIWLLIIVILIGLFFTMLEPILYSLAIIWFFIQWIWKKVRGNKNAAQM